MSPNALLVADSGHARTAGYQDAIAAHWNVIRTRTTENPDGMHMEVNTELTPQSTYGDLKNLLTGIMRNEVSAFKIQIGFAAMLYDLVNQEYRYFYVSTNQYLFDTAYTISTNRDMTDFYDKILALDLANTYYMNRPASGGILTGFPNVFIKIMRIPGIPIGAGEGGEGAGFPDYIKKVKVNHFVDS